MIFSKEQILSLIEKVGQPEGSIVINSFFNNYRKYLKSDDVANLYDEDYLRIIESHPPYTIVNGLYKINIYNQYSYNYILPKLKNEDKILDIGCGNGDFALAIATHSPQKVVGIDFSLQNIQAAQKKLESSGLSNCSFFKLNVSELKSQETFKYIILNDVIEHLSDDELEHLFKTIKTLINSQSEVVIHTPNGLALCNDVDSNLIQKIYKLYQRYRYSWKGMERSVTQIYYDQVHINIMSYKQLDSFLKKYGFKTRVIYDEKHKYPIFNSMSSNMLVIGSIKG